MWNYSNMEIPKAEKVRVVVSKNETLKCIHATAGAHKHFAFPFYA